MNWIKALAQVIGPFVWTLLTWLVNGALKSEERARQAEFERDEIAKSQAQQAQREKDHVRVVEEISAGDLTPGRINELLTIDTSQNSPAYRPKGTES